MLQGLFGDRHCLSGGMKGPLYDGMLYGLSNQFIGTSDKLSLPYDPS
jgi:hypothetical protein